MNNKVFVSEIVKGKSDLLFAIPVEMKEDFLSNDTNTKVEEAEGYDPNDLIFVIPNEIVETLNLKENDDVHVSLETDGKIILKFTSQTEEESEMTQS